MDSAKVSGIERVSWFESGKSLQYITENLEEAKDTIRIATGFFTIKGWNLVRRYTTNKKTYILVGIDEPGEQRARMALIQEIMRDLRTGLDITRRESVQELVEKMQSNQFELVDARARDHHNKLYICDTKVAIQTSSNLTGKGLTEQVEGGTIITQESEIIALIQEFDNYFDIAQDLTQELLEILLKWLKLATPWDIYLKTMLMLESIKPPEEDYYLNIKKPLSYQTDMIAQTLRQIKMFGGSMIVASTGLGKTIVAVHVAIHLKKEKLIGNVMIIGPKAVRSSWEREMRQAEISCQYFVHQTFDRKSSKQDHSLELFQEILEDIEKQNWLIIIDESHEFRNRFKKNLFNLKKHAEERRAFLRIRELVKKGNQKVLLLTGSPYARDVDNINSQLYLLPHSFENNSHEPRYLLEPLPEFNDLYPEESKTINAWRVDDSDSFIKLPVVSQLTTPHVAKYYGLKDEQGTYIVFKDEKRYVPDVILHSINFPLMVEISLTKAIMEGYFKVKPPNPMFKDLFNRLVKIAWSSSPLALQGFLERVADTPEGENSYKLEKLEFSFSRQDREDRLRPIISEVKRLSSDHNNDIKLRALTFILQERKDDKQKVIIFCERRATVFYILQKLQQIFPTLNIIATIEQSEDEKKYEMKDSREIEEMIKKFAPRSNQSTGQYLETYEVFISTDAHGVGVNMQDASIVVNYDIDWTPIALVQRAGRILRFWHSPRTVEIYTFIPKLTDTGSTTNTKYDLVEIQKRWRNLIYRHQESSKIIDLPVLTTEKTQEVNISEVASQITIKSGELDIDKLADLEISPYYQHTAKLQMNRDYAESLDDDLVSAKVYSGKHPLIYMLLLCNREYHGIFYNLETQELTEPDINTILNDIACEDTTPIAHIDYDKIEKSSNACLEKWCKQNNILFDSVERICSLYLKPENENDNLKELLIKTM